MPTKVPNTNGLTPLLPQLNGSNSTTGMRISPSSYFKDRYPWHAFSDISNYWDTDPRNWGSVTVYLDTPIVIDHVMCTASCTTFQVKGGIDNVNTMLLDINDLNGGVGGVYKLDKSVRVNQLYFHVSYANYTWVLINRLQVFKQGLKCLLEMDNKLYTLNNVGEFVVVSSFVTDDKALFDKSFDMTSLNSTYNGKVPLKELQQMGVKFKIHTLQNKE